MKRVSSNVTKVIKKAGYPLVRFQTVNRKQFEGGHGYKYSTDKNFYTESPSILHPKDKNTIDMYFCPYAMEVWFWLWREKKIAIGCPYENTYNYWFTNINAENDESLILWKYSSRESKDPEEAIIAAIEYLVENNLIK